MGRIFREFNDEKWTEVRTHPYYQKLRESTLYWAEKYRERLPAHRRFRDLHRYVLDGNREVYEAAYNEYFSRLETYFLAYEITLDEEYLVDLADAVWDICDMESWSIPAHVNEKLTIAERRKNLDLCSTIAGFRLAEVLYFLGDKLPELVVRRANAEIRYRVIESYRDFAPDRYWWPQSTNNWSAVCIAAILGTYIYAATPEETDAQLPRMLDTIRCYLSGFGDDGCCVEGYGYWNYGFSFFCVFASLLCEYTDGRINLFEDEKVKRIARFQEIVPLNESECVCFSDCNPGFVPLSWLSHFLKGVYPDLRIPAIPPVSGPAPLRYVLWQNPEFAESTLDSTGAFRHVFEDAQWFIYRAEGYSFAAKAGHNDEPHNHNDVGSFVISKGGRVTFVDPGVGEYTAQYFGNGRYELALCSSRGHSVPIINGEYQICSKTKSTILECADDRYKFTVKDAYGVPSLLRFERGFLMEKQGVRLTDSFEFSELPDSLVERFVALSPITLGEGCATVGASNIRFDKEKFTASLSSEQVARKGGKTDTLYYLDLTLISPEKQMTLEFYFD